MARENQGLQIALIIFVMLTLILGVTSFLFFKQAEDAEARAKRNLRQATEQETKARTTAEENQWLKQKMGFAVTEDRNAIEPQFLQDMQTYAATFPEDIHTYRQVVARLFEILQTTQTELVAAQRELEQQNARFAAHQQSIAPQIQQHKQRADQIAQEMAAERAKYKEDYNRVSADKTTLAQQVQEARKQSTAEVAQVQAQLQSAGQELLKLRQLLKSKEEQLTAVTTETVDVPDGEIRWVNQREGTVWINLGRADGLRRQVTFSVYPSDLTNLSEAVKKGSIEVTRILGDQVAEARIVEDTISDPIMPGDKIHTPLWHAGEQLRFALAGLIDIDNDGLSDQEEVRNLITMHGGLVDCEMDPKTGERIGQMTVNTRYLVVGEAPKKDPQFLDSWSKMHGDAQRLGVRQLSVAELLQRMGWRPRTRAVNYGPGMKPEDFRPQLPEGGQRVSGGNVSGLFRPRTPPAPNRGGAY